MKNPDRLHPDRERSTSQGPLKTAVRNVAAVTVEKQTIFIAALLLPPKKFGVRTSHGVSHVKVVRVLALQVHVRQAMGPTHIDEREAIQTDFSNRSEAPPEGSGISTLPGLPRVEVLGSSRQNGR
eukprot:6188065-Pleurochrysis_carterae.AAC.1